MITKIKILIKCHVRKWTFLDESAKNSYMIIWNCRSGDSERSTLNNPKLCMNLMSYTRKYINSFYK